MVACFFAGWALKKGGFKFWQQGTVDSLKYSLVLWLVIKCQPTLSDMGCIQVK
jgi:hypothetical protein